MENLKGECNKQNAIISIRDSIEQFAFMSKGKDLFEPFSEQEYKRLCVISRNLSAYRSNEGKKLTSFCDDYIRV